jgi:hypothetical protein
MAVEKLKLSGIVLALLLCTAHSSLAVADRPKEDLRVEVSDGDNLIGILTRVTGSSRRWQEVALYNNLADPDALKPGQIIVIPRSMLTRRGYATVDYFNGEAGYLPIGATQMRPLERGQQIFTGETVRTGENGFISLSFTSESVVNIQPQSDFRIDVINCEDPAGSCEITLWAEEGDAAVKVDNKGFDGATRFIIKTPYASAVVRGTEYDITISKVDGVVANTLGVTEGEVVITTDELERSVPLGKGVVGGQGQSVSRLFDLLDPPIVTNLPHYARVSPEDRVEWLELQDAAGYEISISGSGEALGKTQIARTYSTVDYPAGEYLVAIRGVDQYGLRGYRANQRVTAVDLAEDLVAAELAIDLSLDVLRVEKGPLDAATQFELQVSDRVVNIDGQDTLADYRSYDIGAGTAFNILVDNSRDVFVRYRQIVDATLVSRYTPIELLATGRDQ